MKAHLIDTDVLIDHLCGEEKARRFFKESISQEASLYFSEISKAEIYSGIMPDEEERVSFLFRSMNEVAVDGKVAEDAGRYRKAFLASHKLLLPDALIAASAKRAAAVLITLNQKHYPMKDLEVRIPYKK